MKIEMISCNICKEDMPKLRLERFGYNFCVKCSESKNIVSAKRGVSVQMGEGDHTWNETVLMDENQYKKYTNPEGNPEVTFGIEEE